MSLPFFTQSPEIPVVEIEGTRPGKTLLVTAGMDGDEYAGIEAAWRAIEIYRAEPFAGRLIIVPIMNVRGFANESSENPLDQKWPKYIFPGCKDGSPTERLMHWLTSTYISKADVWLDLHGGAITEGLRPFVWADETGVENIDVLTNSFCENSDAELVVREHAARFSKARKLAAAGCAYVLVESGSRGNSSPEDIGRHLDWIRAMMFTLDMTVHKMIRSDHFVSSIFRRVVFERAPRNGIWHITQPFPAEVSPGAILGTFSSLDGHNTRKLCASTSGVPLWWKETPSMRRGDILCAIGVA